MIGRLLCLLGFHEWLKVMWLRDRGMYFQRCGRHGCAARRVAR